MQTAEQLHASPQQRLNIQFTSIHNTAPYEEPSHESNRILCSFLTQTLGLFQERAEFFVYSKCDLPRRQQGSVTNLRSVKDLRQQQKATRKAWLDLSFDRPDYCPS